MKRNIKIIKHVLEAIKNRQEDNEKGSKLSDLPLDIATALIIASTKKIGLE